MNNDFNYSQGQDNRDPFTGKPQYDFYDELIVKDAKRATSRSMLGLTLYTVAAYALSYAIIIGVMIVFNFVIGDTALYEKIVTSPYFNVLAGTLPAYIAGIPTLFLVIRKLPKRQMPLEKPKMSVPHLLMMIPIAQVAMVAGNYIGTFINNVYSIILGIENHDTVAELIYSTPVWLLIVVTVIIAPIMEELIFRKLLLDRLSVYGAKFAILVTAVAFGLFHGNIDQFFYAMLVGIVLGYVALKSGNWLYSVIVHMVMNFIGGIVPLFVTGSLERVLEWIENMVEDPDAYASIPTEMLGDYMVVMAYSGLMSALVIGGIVLLVLGIRKKWFTLDERLSVRIPRGRVAGVVFGNVGSILFLVISGILITLDLFMPLIEKVLEQGVGV